MNYIPDAFAADAAKALVHLSALDDLRERGWLAERDRGWSISDQHHAMCSSGEKILLGVLDAICNDMGAPLLDVATRLDERNRLAVLGAVGLLLGGTALVPVAAAS